MSEMQWNNFHINYETGLHLSENTGLIQCRVVEKFGLEELFFDRSRSTWIQHQVLKNSHKNWIYLHFPWLILEVGHWKYSKH